MSKFDENISVEELIPEDLYDCWNDPIMGDDDEFLDTDDEWLDDFWGEEEFA